MAMTYSYFCDLQLTMNFFVADRILLISRKFSPPAPLLPARHLSAEMTQDTCVEGMRTEFVEMPEGKEHISQNQDL